MPASKFLRRRDVEERTGLKRSTIYKYAKDGRFPKPIRIGPNTVAWLESDVDKWQQEQIDASGNETWRGEAA